MSNAPVCWFQKLVRLMDARLQAVSSRNIYSLHGLLALMRPSVGQVCHSLMVVSNCTPGSAHDQAAKAIWSHRSRARSVRRGLGARPCFLAFSFSVRQYRCQGPSSLTAPMKAESIRTELLEFWPETV